MQEWKESKMEYYLIHSDTNALHMLNCIPATELDTGTPSSTACSCSILFRSNAIALVKIDSGSAFRSAHQSSICLPMQPTTSDEIGKMDPKQECVITTWRAADGGDDSIDYIHNEPHYRVATPHRRSRCEPFFKEQLICADGKGFGNCKGTSASTLTCSDNGIWKVYGIGGIVPANSTCEKGAVSTFTDVARHSDWIRQMISYDKDPKVDEIYSAWGEWTTCTVFCNGKIHPFKQVLIII